MDGEQKRIVLLARKNGLSFDQLMDHWTKIHAPLVSSIPTIRARRSCYIQNHLDRTVKLPARFDYDGITELFIKTPPAGTPVLEGSPDYDAVKSDERAQFDMTRSINLPCSEHVIRRGLGNSKLVILVRRRAGVSLKEFIEHWRALHAKKVIEEDRVPQRILGYVQNLIAPGKATGLDGRAVRDGEGFDGVSEIWFGSAQEAQSSLSKLAYFDQAAGDADIIDRTATQAHLFHERVIYRDDTPIHS